jgi:hypothetical protein
VFEDTLEALKGCDAVVQLAGKLYSYSRYYKSLMSSSKVSDSRWITLSRLIIRMSGGFS